MSRDQRDKDEPWTLRDLRDVLLIIASMAGALVALFAVLYLLGLLFVALFGFPDIGPD